MKIPHTRATDTFQQVIRKRSDTYKVTRQTGVETVGAGEKRETTETVSVDALLYAPDTTSDMFQFGDRLSGDLNGIALPTADVQQGDEFTHGGVTYEVNAEPDTFPSGSDPQVKRFGLDRIVNNR